MKTEAQIAKDTLIKARELIAGPGVGITGPTINLNGFKVENDSYITGTVAAASLIEAEVSRLCRMTDTPWEIIELYEQAVKDLGIANICRI